MDLAQITSKPVTTKLRDITAEEGGRGRGDLFPRGSPRGAVLQRPGVGQPRQAGRSRHRRVDRHRGARRKGRVRPTRDAPDKAILPTVDQWRAFELGGKHFDYKRWNDMFTEYPEKHGAAQKDPTNLDLTELLEEQKKLDPT